MHLCDYLEFLSVILTNDGLYAFGEAKAVVLNADVNHTSKPIALPKKLDAFEGKLVQSISCGLRHTLVVMKDGSLWGFGVSLYFCLLRLVFLCY